MYLRHLTNARNSELGEMLMADDKNQGNRSNESQNRPGQQQHEQQRRGPGSEQQDQGDQSNQRRGNPDQEREEKERKRA